MTKEIVSSPEGFPVRDYRNTPGEQDSPQTPVVGKGKAPAEPIFEPTLFSFKTPPKKSVVKRKVSPKQSSTQGPAERPSLEPRSKKGKKAIPSTTSSKLTQLLQKSVVRGKIIKVGYFEEQGLEVFLDKLMAQGWLELFTNTQLGCSVSDLAEFYANCSVPKVS